MLQNEAVKIERQTTLCRPPASRFRWGNTERNCGSNVGVNTNWKSFWTAFCESNALAKRPFDSEGISLDYTSVKLYWWFGINCYSLAAIKFTAPWHIGVSGTLMASALWCGWPCHSFSLFGRDCWHSWPPTLITTLCPWGPITQLTSGSQMGTAMCPCREVSLP